MNGTRTTIPVLRFRAGSMHLGIAAEDVLSVVTSDVDVPHIATVLGTETRDNTDDAPDDPTVRPASPVEQRVIRVAASDEIESFAFAADAPVRVALCRSRDVLPMASMDLVETWRPVMGFASIEGRTVVLLDITSVARRLLEQRGRGLP